MLNANPKQIHAASMFAPEHMAELLQRIARTQDREAFRELFIQYGPRVKGLLIRQGADTETAEELMQETLLTVWKKAHLFSDYKGSVSTWIFTIARNLRIDRIRAETVWMKMDYETVDRPSDDMAQDDYVEEGQRREKLNRALEVIPQDQREVLFLSYVDGFSHSEIAEKLQLPIGTVKSRMRLAYEKVRELLKDEI